MARGTRREFSLRLVAGRPEAEREELSRALLSALRMGGVPAARALVEGGPPAVTPRCSDGLRGALNALEIRCSGVGVSELDDAVEAGMRLKSDSDLIYALLQVEEGTTHRIEGLRVERLVGDYDTPAYWKIDGGPILLLEEAADFLARIRLRRELGG